MNLRQLLGLDPKSAPILVRSVRDPDTGEVLGWFWSCSNAYGHRLGVRSAVRAYDTGAEAIAGALEHIEAHRRYAELDRELRRRSV